MQVEFERLEHRGRKLFTAKYEFDLVVDEAGFSSYVLDLLEREAPHSGEINWLHHHQPRDLIRFIKVKEARRTTSAGTTVVTNPLEEFFMPSLTLALLSRLGFKVDLAYVSL